MKSDSGNIIGRMTEISSLLSILKTHSIVLSSHRRMGKTMLLKKMAKTCPSNFKPVLIIVEGKSNPEEFVHDLYHRLLEKKIISATKSNRFKEWYEKNLAGLELKDMKLPSFRPHWKEALRKIIEDVLEQNNGSNVVILIDEFPMMLYKFIKEYDMALEAIDLLDTLREIRQLFGDSGIKFIFCGSIGINVVLDLLRREQKYAGEPINDMSLEILDAMTSEDAELLAKHLIKTKNVKVDKNIKQNLKELCKQVDNMPFYIDLVIKELDIHQKRISKENILTEVDRLINSPANQGQFNHFSDRINTYYESDIKPIAKEILDWLSKQDTPKSEDEILNHLASKRSIQLEELKPVLKKLFEDLYLTRLLKEGIRCYAFKYSLLKKWWFVNLS
jgi:hypothetical protein